MTPVLLMNYDLRYGGTERQLVEAALHLDRSRFLPHVGCIRLQGGRRGELERAGVPLVEFSFPSFFSKRAFSAARKLTTYLRRHRIRILHSFDVPSTAFAVPVGFAARLPVVLASQRAFRELTPGLTHKLLRVTDRLADGVVVNSANLRKHLEETDGLKASRTTLIYNSVDLERFAPGPDRVDVLPDCRVVIGSTAMLRPEKGVEDLLEAFAMVAQQRTDVGLLLVGGGPLYQPIRNRVRELGLEDRCHIAGGVTDVLPWLRRMDIFVLPSHSEALSNSLLEAMSVGCTAVASDVGGNPEIVIDGQTGLLFEPKNAQDLAAKLASLLAHEGVRQALTATGQDYVRSNFSRAQSLYQLGELYSVQLERAGVAV